MNVIKPIVVKDRVSLVEMRIGNDVLNFATYLQYIATQLFWTAIFKHQKYRYLNRFTLLQITFLNYKQYVELPYLFITRPIQTYWEFGMIIDWYIQNPFKNQNTMPMRYYWLLFLFISLLLSGCNKSPEDEKSSVVSSETFKPSQASAIEVVVLKKDSY